MIQIKQIETMLRAKISILPVIVQVHLQKFPRKIQIDSFQTTYLDCYIYIIQPIFPICYIFIAQSFHSLQNV